MLSEFQRAQAERLLAPLCVVPPHVQDQLRIIFRFEKSEVILLEARPSFRDREQWAEHPIAKFRYIKTSASWHLFCLHRDLRWHEYQPLPESPELEMLVAEVKKDPTGIFWG